MTLTTAPHPRDLPDEQGDLIEPFLAVPSRRKDRHGHPWTANRAVLNGILSIAPHRTSRNSGRETAVRCVDTDGSGRSSDSLPGSRTFAGSLYAMSDSPRAFSECYTLSAV